MTVWNDEQRARHLAGATWMANTAVLMHLNERATGDPARDWLSSWAHRWFVGDALRVLVLGCGEGWLERAIAQWPFVARIDAVDFAEEAVSRARDAARGIDKIHYGVVDLNRDELPSDTYDVVIAHSVLHHVLNLEHAYAQLERTMRANATLIVNEYVGPNRFQYSDDVLTIINTLLACIGQPPKQRPSVEEMIANDPSEAVRSEELIAFTERAFEVLERKNIGGTILQHLLYETIARFRFENARERSILELLCSIEAMLVDSGRVPCDYVILAARKRGATVQRAKRALPPRPEAAKDVEGDPLWKNVGTGLSPSGGGLKPAPHFVRLAILAQQPRRANLYKRSSVAAFLERFRTRTFDDPAVACLLRTAATLAPREAR
ncbi:MAG TPA: methyltransferase domain-containing protein [Thermoanaerobaculia bacterium]|jgi:SAM-dependent methyltransferase|nr:methyltransferase domain-containing protein [Thermoanaerobaculia bacterium]